MIVYKTTNLINGKIYIGQTTIKNDNYIGSGTVMKEAIKKYGKKIFKKEIIEVCDSIEQLNSREEYWISFYNSFVPNGYNLREGGNYSHHSEATKLKISKSKIGKKLTKEHIAAVVKSITGKKRSQETKDKIGSKHRNKIVKDSTKKLIHDRESKIVTCPHCNKSGAQFPMRKWHFSNCKSLILQV